MSKGGLPQLDVTWFPSQLFWLALTFVTLYLILARSSVPTIQAVLHSRQSRLDGDLDAATTLKTQAAQAKETYEFSLQDARNQAQTMLAEVTQKIKHNSEEKSRELDAMLAAKMAESDKQIAKATETAMSNLAPLATDVSGNILEILLHKKVDNSTVNAVVQKLIKEVA